MREVWPSKAAGVLGTTAATKASRGLGGLSKEKYILEVL